MTARPHPRRGSTPADPPARDGGIAAWLDRSGRAIGIGLPRRIARRIAASADAERDAGRQLGAALLYDEAYRLAPRRHDLLVQSAHMYKEAGDLVSADSRYRAARELLPEDADLALQIGHFHRVAGRLPEAAASYARAAVLRPGWAEPERERATLIVRADDVPPAMPGQDDPAVRELMPDPSASIMPPIADLIHIRRLGARTARTRWGVRPTLAGVEAIRGFCLTRAPAVELVILLDGAPVHREPLAPAPDRANGPHKHVFNAWVDFSMVPPGAYAIELRLEGGDVAIAPHVDRIVVTAPPAEADAPGSDAVVTLASGDARSAEAQIRARPSMIRPAARGLFDAPVTAVLVQRVDQLGDLAVSVPAIRRVRALFPDARLVGLLSGANAALGAALGLFDAIVVADFAEDPRLRRRVMPAAAQRALAARLAAFAFDLAIDLSPDPVSRPILLLSGARFLHGFDAPACPWLMSRATGQVRDPGNMHEAGAHAGKLVALVDWLGAIARSRHRVEPLAMPSAAGRLERYGIAPGEAYAVLHCGARLAFSRWPSFAELADAIVARTALRVVVLGAEPPADASLPARIRYHAADLPFDDLDALLAGAAVFVGNDSGPKHLAALRGTKVVSVHMARVNWSEWGQEGAGFVVSRRVPCAGCAIHHEPDECGKGFACLADIAVEEVMEAVMRCLGSASPGLASDGAASRPAAA